MNSRVNGVEMKHTEKQRLEPKLRFSEFRNTRGWIATGMIDLLNEHKTKNDGKCEVHSVSVNKGLVNQIEHLGRSFAATDTSKYNLVMPHDIVYTRSPTGDFPYGIIKQNQKAINVIVSPLYGVFTPKNKHVGYVLDVYFESPIRANNYLQSIAQKGAKNTVQLSNETFLSKELYFPDDELEQQKLADCLSSIGELIAAQTQKLDSLKDYKKGLMQQLFPAIGETLPKLRFPEFQDAGEWKERKAGTLFTNRTEKGEATLPIYSVTMNDGMVKRSSLERNFDDIADPAGNKKVHENDIAYNMMRMWQGACGVAMEDCMVSPAYVILAPKDDACSAFFGHLLKLPKYLRLLTSHSQGLTLDRLRLYYKDFAQISLVCPSFPEQQKISEILSSVDELIAAQIQKIDALQVHKKGLMQQLFPVLDEGQE